MRLYIEDNFNTDGPLHDKTPDIIMNGGRILSEQEKILRIVELFSDPSEVISGNLDFLNGFRWQNDFSDISVPWRVENGRLYGNLYSGSAIITGLMFRNYDFSNYLKLVLALENNGNGLSEGELMELFLDSNQVSTGKRSTSATYVEDVRCEYPTTIGRGNVFSCTLPLLSFTHGDVRWDGPFMVGGSSSGPALQTRGLFQTFVSDSTYPLIHPFNLQDGMVNQTFIFGFYFSDSPNLPTSLEGMGLVYAGQHVQHPLIGLNFVEGTHVWMGLRNIVTFSHFMDSYPRLGFSCRNGIITLYRVGSIGNISGKQIQAGNTWYAPLGDYNGYAEENVGTFLRPGYASSENIFAWNDNTIDFSRVEVPETPNYRLRFNKHVPATPVLEIRNSVMNDSNFWNYENYEVLDWSFSKWVFEEDYLGGGVGGWSIGNITGGSGVGRGIPFASFQVYAFLTLTYIGG